MSRYDPLKERALANVEALFNHWGLQYVKINHKEYDFLNPTREDTNHGACRFNVEKGRGADFTGSDITNADIAATFGPGFNREDFQGIGSTERAVGFDIIGLVQKLFQCNDYIAAAKLLRRHLAELGKKQKLVKPLPNAAEIRTHKQSIERLNILKSAERSWGFARPYEHTIGDAYLKKRNIHVRDEPNIRFHAKVSNSELKTYFPCLLFKVSKEPKGPLEAIHRIYLNHNGSILNVNDPKKALGNIQGAGIWFGTPGPMLCVAEGPENALSIRCVGYPFAVSTVYSTNYHSLSIPTYVKILKLFPDPDQAGRVAVQKAISKYKRPDLLIQIVFPPEKTLSNGKLADWNDILRGLGE